jgi:hypothetical protein
VETERRLTLSEYDKGEYASGGPRFDKIVRFATVELVKAGWLHKEKGRWTVSSEGDKAYRAFCHNFGHKNRRPRRLCCKCLTGLVEPRGIEPLTS